MYLEVSQALGRALGDTVVQAVAGIRPCTGSGIGSDRDSGHVLGTGLRQLVREH